MALVRPSYGTVTRVSLAFFAVLALAGGPAIAQSAMPTAQGAPIPTCPAAQEVSALASGPMSAPQGSPAPANGELTVFAAASLKGAFEAFAPTYLAETGQKPVYSFDASSAVRTQIEQGAPADIFASADVVNVQTLLDAGLATDPVAFACNQLTIVVPAGNPAGIASAADLAKPGVKVIAAGPEVPITRYATALVTNLGLADAYAANVVSEEDNVAAVRAKVEAGEGDVAIVYVTDALASGDKVEQVPVPVEANVPATYAAAVVGGTDRPDAAAAFLDWLTGPEGQAALGAFGFLPAPTADAGG